METKTLISPAEEKKQAFLAQLSEQWGKEDTYQNLRNEARQTLEEEPAPTTRTEAWKYTRVTRILKEAWKKGSAEAKAQAFLLPELDAWTLVFVNGQFREDVSTLPDQEGITVTSLSEENDAVGTLSAHKEDWFEALNTAYFQPGISIRAAKNTSGSKPVYILHVGSGDTTASFLRHHITVEQGAQLDVCLHFAAEEGSNTFHSCITEGSIGENATLHIDKIQEEHDANFLHATEWFDQQRDSHFDIRTITLQGGWVRNNLNIRVNGSNCTTNLFGTYMPKNKEHVDNHTMVDHRVPHCESNEVYKGIVDDKATGVFNGKVFVRQDAQKTNAYQQNANIVLTDDATINAKPELEIYADDVKCSHGSTTGQFDEDAVFYLRARGLSDSSARKLLTQAFVSEIVEAIQNEAIREYCLSKIESKALT